MKALRRWLALAPHAWARMDGDQRFCAAVVAVQCAIFALTSLDRVSNSARAFVETVYAAGCLDCRVFEGQWWRAFTHMWLHGSPFHLISNMLSLAALYAVGARSLAPWRWFLAFLITGAAAGPLNALLEHLPPPDFSHWTGPVGLYFFQPGTAAVGASGGITGLWGLLTAVVLRVWWMRRRGLVVRNPVRVDEQELGPAWMLGPFVLQMLLDSRMPGVAGIAHVMGFLVGLLLLPLARPVHPERE